jgi:hypothetical protein
MCSSFFPGADHEALFSSHRASVQRMHLSVL